ncbi:hypothetical protein KQX54_018922 [Cotesia glomerata]|uniref:Gustatory receptor n=1 Tax=Cotesia glomerata TaxID=32391 RepID=A0AAV7IT27_COTGL|nr:hypothetical protein KQX54_018922 [Cotesia glomerata]
MNLAKLSKSKTLLIRLLIIFFKISGFAPFKVSVLPKPFFKKRSRIQLLYSPTGIVYNFILSLPMIGLLVFNIAKHNAEDSTYILGKCMVTSSALAAPMILGYYCIKQGAIIEVLSRLLKLEDDLLDKFNRSVSRLHKSITYETVVFVIYTSLTSSHVALTYFEYPGLWERSLVTLFIEITINNLIFQYSLIVYYINKRLSYMNELLLSLSKSDNSRLKNEVTFITSSSHNEMILKTIVLIRELQRSLYGVFKEISKFFTWPIFFAMTIFCIRILLYVFKFVKRLILHPEETTVVIFIICPISVLKEMYIIIIMTRHMTQITLEMQKTGEIIYKIMDIYSTSGKIQSELEQFSIEILLRRIPKSIFGLFTIDSSHVATVIVFSL